MLAAGWLLLPYVWIGLVPACRGFTDWIYPGNEDSNLTFNYIDVVYFTWASSIDEPWMNLWCAPSANEPQSKDYVYHSQVPTNGSNPQSFPYSDYNQKGLCHMQIESFSGDDYENTPVFGLTSNDGVSPKTWGIAALGEAGGSPDMSNIQELPSIPSTLLVTATSTSSSTTSTALSSASSASSTISHMASLTSPTSSSTTLPPPSQASASSNSNDQSSLTPAAKAGISIGSIFSFLVLVCIILLARLLWSRRQRQRAQLQGREGHGGTSDGPQDPQYRSMPTKNYMVEIGEGRSSRHEINGEGMPMEIQGRPRAELFGETGALER